MLMELILDRPETGIEMDRLTRRHFLTGNVMLESVIGCRQDLKTNKKTQLLWRNLVVSFIVHP